MYNSDLFESPIRSVKVRKYTYAHQYRNGTINIDGMKYIDYSIRDAIRLWRKKNPIK